MFACKYTDQYHQLTSIKTVVEIARTTPSMTVGLLQEVEDELGRIKAAFTTTRWCDCSNCKQLYAQILSGER